MQRLLTLVFLLCLAIPAGISFSGCTRNPAANYCNGQGYGLKLTSVATITLAPQTTGISLAYGQTQQLSSPSPKNCKGDAAAVGTYVYGTTNNQAVDVSPSGNLCAGTWNRRSGGGIPDFTICNLPASSATNNLPYATAYVTATAQGVSSNAVTVYTHAPVTAVSLVLEKSATDSTPVVGCLSQTQTAQLDSKAFYNLDGQQELLCGPTPTAGNPNLPKCSVAIGNLTFSSQNGTVATINETGQITAQLPGTTYITASVAGSGSSAGYFSTCPPKTIGISLNGQTSGTVTQGVTQNMVTTITDINDNPIQGLALDYQSTNPLDISVSNTGAITAKFAGKATVYAVCQPPLCNPAPIDKVGVNQTGTPVTSNPVNITTPGQASDYLWMASSQSQSFVPVELISGTIGSPVKMPYVPNSMVMDQSGTNLYFGSTHELMVYGTGSNSLTKEDPNVPGVVLAAAPNNQTILINDPARQIFYLYAPAAGSYSTYSGVGFAAQWTPDSRTLYVVGTSGGASTLFVYNLNTGWTTYPLSSPSTGVAVTVPGIGAFLSGNATSLHAWCPTLTAANTIVQAYPAVPPAVPVQTDVLAATTDGAHILGIGLNGGTTPTLSDIGVDFSNSLNMGACPSVPSGGIFTSTNITTSPVTQVLQTGGLGFTASAIDQIVPSPASNLAFITYTPTAGAAAPATLPYYEPAANGTLGTIGQVTLTGTPTAPIAGAFSLDDTLFFVSTAGDNLVHYIDVNKLKDTQQIRPGLTDANGNSVPATFIAVKPRSTT